jgi:lysophospholipase L1-like esterase
MDFVLVAHSGIAGLDADAIDRAAITVVDLSEIASRTDLRWHHDGHFNPQGHRQVAESLAPVIESRLRARAARP